MSTLNERESVAIAVEAKAQAIAAGDYDKDVDWNIRDRVLWSAALYAVAEHIRAKVKLTPSEREHLDNAANYLPMNNTVPFLIREL